MTHSKKSKRSSSRKSNKSRKPNKYVLTWNKALKQAGYGLPKKGSSQYNEMKAKAQVYIKQGIKPFQAYAKARKDLNIGLPKKGSKEYAIVKNIFEKLLYR